MTSAAYPFDFGIVERKLLQPGESELGIRPLAERMNFLMSESAVRRARDRGLTYPQADRIAIRVFGLHPIAIWGEQWLELAMTAVAKSPATDCDGGEGCPTRTPSGGPHSCRCTQNTDARDSGKATTRTSSSRTKTASA